MFDQEKLKKQILNKKLNKKKVAEKKPVKEKTSQKKNKFFDKDGVCSDGKTGFLLADDFCRGCSRCSIDYYGTNHEQRFCCRDEEGGVVRFVRINEQHRVDQCNLRVRAESYGGY